MTKPLTEAHVNLYREEIATRKPPFGGQLRTLSALCYDVMGFRFLATGSLILALILVLATLPLVARGKGSPACTITGTGATDLLEGSSANDVICGRGGADIITAKGGNDIVRGGAGRDTIYGDQGGDRLYGGKGADDIYARDSQRDELYGGPGLDYGRVDNPLDVITSIEST
jgi:hypothetical protein